MPRDALNYIIMAHTAQVFKTMIYYFYTLMSHANFMRHEAPASHTFHASRTSCPDFSRFGRLSRASRNFSPLLDSMAARQARLPAATSYSRLPMMRLEYAPRSKFSYSYLADILTPDETATCLPYWGRKINTASIFTPL